VFPRVASVLRVSYQPTKSSIAELLGTADGSGRRTCKNLDLSSNSRHLHLTTFNCKV
jgi:hypothetical protein